LEESGAVKVAELGGIDVKKATEDAFTWKPPNNFNSPKVAPSKAGRSYTGPATKLMNELYDAAAVSAIEMLPGWERIALVMARACERLESAGWKKAR